MLNFYKKSNKKRIIISLFLSNIFLINSFSFAYAAEDELTERDKEIIQKINNNVDSQIDGSISSKNEEIYKNAVASEKQLAEQQKNESSSSAANTYFVTRKATGTSTSSSQITITENPCFGSNESKCSTMQTITSLNSSGNTNIRTVPISSLQYIASDGQEITADILNQVNSQKAISSGSNSAASGVATVLANLTNKNMSPLQRGLLALTMIINANTEQSNIKNIKQKENAEQKEKDKKEQEELNKAENIQNKRNELQTENNSLFTVKINPLLPVNSDNKNVTMTLIPKHKMDASSYSIQATFINLQTEKTEKFDVKENVPFIVELGENVTNRLPGERIVTIIYTYKNSNESKKINVKYKVNQYQNALINDNTAVSNSVLGAVENEDLYASSNSALSIAGKVTKATYDDTSGRCKLEMQDPENAGDTNAPSVKISSSNISKENCVAGEGKYASFDMLTASYDINGSAVFEDSGNANTSNYNLSEEQYNQIESQSAQNIDGAEGDVYYYKDGQVSIGKEGTAGADWVQLSNKALVNIGTAKDGTLIFTDSLNNPLSDAQCAEISQKISFDINQLTISRDDNGMATVSTPSGQTISSSNGFTSEYLKNKQQNTNKDNKYKPKILKKVTETISKTASLFY